MKRLLISGLAIASLILGVNEVQAVTKSVDNFKYIQENSDCYDSNFGDIYIKAPPGGNPTCQTGISTESGLPTEDTIGGHRLTTINEFSNSDENKVTRVRIEPLSVADESLNIVNSDGANRSVTIEWKGGSGGLGIDNLMNYEGFEVSYFDVTVATQLLITVYDSNNNSASSTQTVDPTTNERKSIFALKEFQGNTSVLNGPISSIKMTVSSTNSNYEMSINDIMLYGLITPEPSLILGCVVSLGIGLLTTRRNK